MKLLKIVLIAVAALILADRSGGLAEQAARNGDASAKALLSGCSVN